MCNVLAIHIINPSIQLNSAYLHISLNQFNNLDWLNDGQIKSIKMALRQSIFLGQHIQSYIHTNIKYQHRYCIRWFHILFSHYCFIYIRAKLSVFLFVMSFFPKNDPMKIIWINEIKSAMPIIMEKNKTFLIWLKKKWSPLKKFFKCPNFSS